MARFETVSLGLGLDAEFLVALQRPTRSGHFDVTRARTVGNSSLDFTVRDNGERCRVTVEFDLTRTR